LGTQALLRGADALYAARRWPADLLGCGADRAGRCPGPHRLAGPTYL